MRHFSDKFFKYSIIEILYKKCLEFIALTVVTIAPSGVALDISWTNAIWLAPPNIIEDIRKACVGVKPLSIAIIP